MADKKYCVVDDCQEIAKQVRFFVSCSCWKEYLVTYCECGCFYFLTLPYSFAARPTIAAPEHNKCRCDTLLKLHGTVSGQKFVLEPGAENGFLVCISFSSKT